VVGRNRLEAESQGFARPLPDAILIKRLYRIIIMALYWKNDYLDKADGCPKLDCWTSGASPRGRLGRVTVFELDCSSVPSLATIEQDRLDLKERS
jgi:hypothetical protein